MSNTRQASSPAREIGGRPPRRVLLVGAVALVVVAVDQLTKQWALEELADGPVHLFWTVELRLVRNSGAAFGIGRGLGPVLSLVAVAVLIMLSRSVRDVRGVTASVSLGMIFGGAAGNLLDRLLRGGEGLLRGEVVDFVDLGWWPVFNVADASVVCGVALFLLASALRKPRPASPHGVSPNRVPPDATHGDEGSLDEGAGVESQ
ncbi:MAG: lipoprotein signal peptidase [Acidimicrobiales bacterium]|nr:MAG: lipoprotein signal peptidase [Acidimicrobiales bacterium]